MQTYFLNTSKAVSLGSYRDLFFEGQIAGNEIIFPAECIALDDLNRQVDQIATRIHQEADMTRDIRLALYVEIPKPGPVAGNMAKTARLRAGETLQCLMAESTILNACSERGIVLKQLVFILGEPSVHSDNDNPDDYREEAAKLKDSDDLLADSYWSFVALPDPQSMPEYCKAGKDISISKLIARLKENAVRNEDCFVREGAFYDSLLSDFAVFLSDRIKSVRNESDISLFPHDLASAVKAHADALHQRFSKSEYKGASYWRLPAECHNPLERQRLQCRLMLFLYALAHDGSHEDNLFGLEGGKNPVKAREVPEPDYDALEKCLLEKRRKCADVGFEELPLPPLLRNEPFVLDPPENLKPPVLDVQVAFDSRTPLRKLSDKVTSVLDEMREKSRTNQETIRKFINRKKANYDRTKADRLEEKTRSIVQSYHSRQTGNPAETDTLNIDDLQNISEDFERSMSDAEVRILKSPGRLIPKESFDKRIDATAKQTAYYFESLRHSLIKVAMCALFVLAFIVPYAYIRRDLFTEPRGYLLFVITAGLAVGALYVSSLYYVRVYKNRICDEMVRLLDDFRKSQQSNQVCLDDYCAFMDQDIPTCYGLHRYGTELAQYREDIALRKQQITFHMRSLEARRQMIDSLLDSLDIRKAGGISDSGSPDGGETPPVQVPLINPEADRTTGSNEQFYVLTSAEVQAILTSGGENRS